MIDSQTVIDYACKELAEHDTDNQELLNIACASASDALTEPLSRISIGGADSTELTKKWALILAAYIAEHGDLDRLSAIEDVYSSYDYPSELTAFVRYMPSTDSDLGSRSANEQRMIDALKEFGMTIVRPNDEAAATNGVTEGEE